MGKDAQMSETESTVRLVWCSNHCTSFQAIQRAHKMSSLPCYSSNCRTISRSEIITAIDLTLLLWRRCGMWWRALERTGQEIDGRAVRRWLASDAYDAHREPCERQGLVDRIFDKAYVAPVMIRIGHLGLGPRSVARIRLWWKFPSRGSIRRSSSYFPHPNTGYSRKFITGTGTRFYTRGI